MHGARVPDEDEEILPFFDTYLDYKDFCVGYRSELSQVVRLTSTLLPEAALQAAQHRLKTVLQICGAVAGPQPQVGLACGGVVVCMSRLQQCPCQCLRYAERPEKLHTCVLLMPLLQAFMWPYTWPLMPNCFGCLDCCLPYLAAGQPTAVQGRNIFLGVSGLGCVQVPHWLQACQPLRAHCPVPGGSSVVTVCVLKGTHHHYLQSLG